MLLKCKYYLKITGSTSSEMFPCRHTTFLEEIEQFFSHFKYVKNVFYIFPMEQIHHFAINSKKYFMFSNFKQVL